MLRLHGVIGRESDPALKSLLHSAEHHDGVELLFIPESDAGRRRFRLTTDKGTDCAVSLDRDEHLVDGALLLLDRSRAIVVRFGAPKTWRLRPASQEAALKLGWNAGNLHWRVRFEDEDLVVLIDGPLADYRARLAALIAGGAVREIAAAEAPP
jgi:urease accessory protein